MGLQVGPQDVDRPSQEFRSPSQVQQLEEPLGERVLGADHVASVEEACFLIVEATRQAESAAYGATPRIVGRSAQLREYHTARDLELLGRGVEVRWLLQHADRSDLGVRVYAETIMNAGGQVRTTAQIHGDLMLFDGRLALLAAVPADKAEMGMLRIMDPQLLSFLSSQYEATWELAIPFGTERDRMAVDSFQHTIVRLLGEGMKDEQIARRLGVSVRTCRSHIADVMRRLDARSRFQAGVRAWNSGLLD